MRARVRLAARFALLAMVGFALTGCTLSQWPRQQAKVNLPSPWATIKAAEHRAAAAAQDSSPRP